MSQTSTNNNPGKHLSGNRDRINGSDKNIINNNSIDHDSSTPNRSMGSSLRLFALLQNVLTEAFQIESHFFTPPYDDLQKIDRGIRSMVWPDYTDKSMHPVSASQSVDRRMVVSKSNLGFYNIIIYLTVHKSPDFISVGPFRAEEFSTDYFSHILKKIQPPAATVYFLRYFYESLPYVSLSSVVNVVKSIAAAFYPEFETIEPVYLEFSQQAHKVLINMDMLQDSSSDYAQHFKEALFQFINTLKKGDTDAAQQDLKNFMRTTRFASSQNISECRNELNALNLYCQMAVMDTPVHASHILKLCTQLAVKISSLNTLEGIAAMSGEICHKYSLLVKNYAFPEYSQTIRAVINYIYLHLDEDLTSSILAQKFKKNPTALSGCFSREVGMSITNFIHQARINEAIRFFNTTKMSVSEVAVAVGFQDFAYFSRLFRRQVGCSPRDYCRSIQ